MQLDSTAHTTGQFELAQNPTEPISAVKYSPTTPTRLLVASWDRHVYLYDTHAEPGGKLLQKFKHSAPVLDICFGQDDDEAFTCGLDWEVRRYGTFTSKRLGLRKLTAAESTSRPDSKLSCRRTTPASATSSTPRPTTS
jgi:WD40 repeat protein